MNKSGRRIFRRAWVKNKGSKATMSRKDELLKLAQLFHSQALRAETPDAKRTLHRMGQYYQNEAAHAPDRRAERQRKLRQFNRYPEQAA
jgi:hypothetical protein